MSILGQIIANTVQPQKQEKLPVSASIKNSTGTSSNTAASGSAAAGNVAANSAVPPKLSENATLMRAEVIDLRTNQVVIQLESGARLSARLEASLPLYIGQKADFLVSQTTDSLITLKLAPENSGENPLIDKILTATGLQKNEHTVTIINELLSHQQPVTGASIRHHMMLSAKYPELPVKDLVLMELHKIPVTKETVSQFSEYRADSHRLLTQGTTLLNTLTEQLASLPEGAEKTAFVKELYTILNAGAEKLNQNLTSVFDKISENSSTTSANSSTIVEQSNLLGSETAVVSSEQPVEILIHGENPTIAEGTGSGGNAENSGTTEVINHPPADTADTPNTAAATNTGAATNAGAASSAALPVPEQPSAALLEIVKQNFLNSFLLSPEDIATEGKVREYYEQLDEQLSALEQLAEKLSKSTNNEAASAPAKQLRSNLSFMDMVNQVFPYVQLPLQFKEQTAHGELYVYEKKRALSGNGSLSALLHLELEALGTTDIFVTLTAASVSARFYLADETAVQLITEELPSLYETLEKAGYSLQTEVTLREDSTEDAPLLEQFLEEHSPAELNRYTFDIRA